MLDVRALCGRVCTEHMDAAIDEMEFGGASVAVLEEFLLARLFEMAGPAIRLIMERAAEAGEEFDRKHEWSGIKNAKVRAWVERHDNPYRVVDFLKRILSEDLRSEMVDRGIVPPQERTRAQRVASALGGAWTSAPFARGR